MTRGNLEETKLRLTTPLQVKPKNAEEDDSRAERHWSAPNQLTQQRKSQKNS